MVLIMELFIRNVNNECLLWQCAIWLQNHQTECEVVCHCVFRNYTVFTENCRNLSAFSPFGNFHWLFFCVLLFILRKECYTIWKRTRMHTSLSFFIALCSGHEIIAMEYLPNEIIQCSFVSKWECGAKYYSDNENKAFDIVSEAPFR